jgi:tetrathionate reductase subunit B
MKVFIVDLDKCNGCYGCQVACKDEHCGNDWMPYARPQPTTGQFWMKVKEKEQGQVPKVFVEYTPWPCMHCSKAPCIEVGGEALYRREDGLVIIDPIKAKGRKDIVESCPFGAIYWNEVESIPQKCTGCAHLVDKGEIPHCVDLCATGGLRFGEAEEFAAEIEVAETMLPEMRTMPSVYYLNLPKFFIGGEVWDPKKNEIIEGAKVTLEVFGGEVVETTTDDFGDFWFCHLEKGRYIMTIKASGFASVEDYSIDLQASQNLGDFPLKREF